MINPIKRLMQIKEKQLKLEEYQVYDNLQIKMILREIREELRLWRNSQKKTGKAIRNK